MLKDSNNDKTWIIRKIWGIIFKNNLNYFLILLRCEISLNYLIFDVLIKKKVEPLNINDIIIFEIYVW